MDIYTLLMMCDPQALADLDTFQFKHHGTHISVRPVTIESAVYYEPVIDLEEIDREMRKAPSRSHD